MVSFGLWPQLSSLGFVNDSPSGGEGPSTSPRILTAEDVRPITGDERRTLERAVQEMITCKAIFTGWRGYIDSFTSGKPGPLEIRIRAHVDSLEESATRALKATESVVRAHQAIGALMEIHLDPGTASRLELRSDALSEVADRARTVHDFSAHIQRHASVMKEEVRSLVETLHEGRRAKNTLKARIMGFLHHMFNAISAVLGAIAVVGSLFHPLSSSVFGAGSQLASTAASMTSDYSRSRGDKGFDDMIQFLRDAIPTEAEAVNRALSNFEACHRLIQLDVELRLGQTLAMQATEAATARTQWRLSNINMQLIPV